tara:strand:+ start:26185 stop:26562 length:378 start_codon:yes stop_codon:yes gene_type:complete
MLDLQPLLDTLSKISGERVLPYVQHTQEGDLQIARIPVQDVNPGDKTDLALRRFSIDWLKMQVENVGVEAKFEMLPAGTSYYTDEKEVPVRASINITWWPKKPEPELEQLKRQQKNWKGNRPDPA